MALDVVIAKPELSRLLSFTQNIGQKKTTMPILANVLLVAGEGELRVSAADSEVAVTAKGEAKVSTTGATTVNAKVFGEVVRELPDGDVRIRVTEGERIEVTVGKTKLKLVGVSADEYPALPGLGVEAKGRISAQQLDEMIAKSLYAVSQDETRFNLTGVCFEGLSEGSGKKSSNSLRLVATDGHRLAMVTRPSAHFIPAQKTIVPRRGLQETRKIIEGIGNADVGIEVAAGFFVLDTKNVKTAIRVIDGDYPDYEQVIPKEKGTKALLPSEELNQALRRVALMVSDKSKAVRMDFSSGNLVISSSSPELGEAREEVEITYDGKPLSIGFNAKYLVDVLTSVNEGQRFTIDLFGELGPGKLSPEGDEGYISIIMPMRL